MTRFYWSVRRELWENRSIYVAPLAVAGLVLIGFGVALVMLPARMRAAEALGPAALRDVVEQPYVAAALVLMLVEIVVAVFYSLDALYGERRDRSILFWKSLPVSDRTTVLAKASIPILVLPLLTFVVTVVTQGIMLLASSAVLTASGAGAAPLWAHVRFLDFTWINLGHLVAMHGIWYAPLYAWLLLVSAWATRLPVLWAIAPPVAIAIVERVAFDSSRFAGMVQAHLIGGGGGSSAGAGGMTMAMLSPHAVGHYLTSAGLWVGLALTAAFLLAAARLRRARG